MSVGIAGPRCGAVHNVLQCGNYLMPLIENAKLAIHPKIFNCLDDLDKLPSVRALGIGWMK